LQRLEILEQLAIHSLTQGKELFPESLQVLLDREPVELIAVLLAQLNLERVLDEHLMLDHQRQVPDPALHPQGIGMVLSN
jgi:hypothetical protein